MANLSEQDKLVYVLRVLKHTELPQPNYHAVAADTGQANPNNAQKKFKAIVESVGFKLVNKQIVGADGSTGTKGIEPPKTPQAPKKASNASAAPAAPKKTPATGNTKKRTASTTSKTSGAGKKRKIREEVVIDDVSEQDGAEGVEIEDEDKGGDTDDDVKVVMEKGTSRARSPTVKAEAEVDEGSDGSEK
ncbi:hypothetical protein LTR64_005710 [Lithohypha guttulata]|uniref:Myb-like DNA-binding domain-containing protein n=1 Tax=Lithohypha guttulata TaxID=1690604 RepID=A0AAN7SVF7_9EURO|nr:hypothetical protein LTR51_002495 [Lithohypha guttulata]KAK5082681.1 hypothetical protein LTR05_006561 [Lithohypha guttulata]